MPTAEIWRQSGAALTAYLKENDISHRAFAEDMGVTHEAVRNWKNGRIISSRHLWSVALVANYPPALCVRLIAQELDVTRGQLLKLIHGVTPKVVQLGDIAPPILLCRHCGGSKAAHGPTMHPFVAVGPY